MENPRLPKVNAGVLLCQRPAEAGSCRPVPEVPLGWVCHWPRCGLVVDFSDAGGAENLFGLLPFKHPSPIFRNGDHLRRVAVPFAKGFDFASGLAFYGERVVIMNVDLSWVLRRHLPPLRSMPSPNPAAVYNTLNEGVGGRWGGLGHPHRVGNFPF